MRNIWYRWHIHVSSSHCIPALHEIPCQALEPSVEQDRHTDSLLVLGVITLLLMFCPVIQTPPIFFIFFLISVQSNGFLYGIFIHLVSADPCSRVPSPNLIPLLPVTFLPNYLFFLLLSGYMYSIILFFWIPSLIFSPPQISFKTSFINLWPLLWPLPIYPH